MNSFPPVGNDGGMYRRGFAPNLVLIGIGLAIVVGVFAISSITRVNTPQSPVSDSEVNTPDIVLDGTSTPPNDDVGAPSQTAPSLPSKPLPPASAPETPSGEEPSSSGGNSGATSESPAATPTPTPEPVSPAVAYDPGFKASSRVTPEIPSENERATLPSCEGKIFPLDPVEFSKVVSIAPTGIFGAASNPPSFAAFDFGTSGEYDIYNIVAPADVYITTIVQETGITADPEDTTVYFALCKDVFGYVTNIKEMSAAVQDLVTDSYRFGKPHTGENACKIEILELVGQGSLFGTAGQYAGKMGFGVIDLRKNRNLANPSAYPIKTNFAACPLEYLTHSAGFYDKLSSENNLCKKM